MKPRLAQVEHLNRSQGCLFQKLRNLALWLSLASSLIGEGLHVFHSGDYESCWRSSSRAWELCVVAELVTSLTGIPRGSGGGSGPGKEGVSISCIITVVRQKLCPYKTNAISCSCRHTPAVWISHSGVSSMYQPVQALESLGRAYVQGPIPFLQSLPQLLWCGLAIALTWCILASPWAWAEATILSLNITPRTEVDRQGTA